MHAPAAAKTWVVAEFPSGEALTGAARQLREKGYQDLDTHSPYPLHEGDEALGLGRSFVPVIALLGALAGLAIGYGLQWYANAFDWPIDIGGRPPHAVPAMIPITFESMVLGA